MSILPTITIESKTYYVDKRLRELRNVDDPHDSITFNDYEHAMKVAAIEIRFSGGEEKHPELWKRLHAEARAYDAIVNEAAGPKLAPEHELHEEAAKPTKRRKQRIPL